MMNYIPYESANNNYKIKMYSGGAYVSIKLDDRQMRILNFLLENDHTTYQE